MPAAEREIVAALFRSLPAEPTPVVLLLTCGDQCEEEAFRDAFQGSAHLKVAHSLEELTSNDGYDAVITNRVLGQQCSLDLLTTSTLNALKLGGVCIIREDLNGHLATDKVAKLTDFFDVYRTADGIGFEFRSLCQVNATIHLCQNFMDVYWTLSKKQFEVHASNGGVVTFRDFLDRTQYTDTGIYAYEYIFGENFISPGGAKENLKVLNRFGKISAGQKMLDIGVGIGGGARQAAYEFGAEVLGLDLSANMLSIALDRLQKDKDTRVRYQIANALECSFEDSHFDMVFSRDCLQHNDDLLLLMTKVFKWLKPGGRLLITMYGKGHGELLPKFNEYVAQRQYHLKTLEQMVEILQTAGFKDVKGTNLTERFKEILIEERAKVENSSEQFLEKFSEKKLKDLIDGWNDKLEYIAHDNHNWIQLFGVKPSL